MAAENRSHVVVIGAGFTGLAAAWQLAREGIRVTVLEGDSDIGGLARGFTVGGEYTLERFYHHWFTGDSDMMNLIRELGAEQQIVLRPTRTGMYFANQRYRLSTPLDLLRFSALSAPGRLRLGWLAIHARRLRNWRALEDITATAWLRRVAGEEVYRVVWEPLLRGKFGAYAQDVSAVWIWNKLKLRGGSRGRQGAEMLAYFRGGFAALSQRLRGEIEAMGGRIRCDTPVLGLKQSAGRVTRVITSEGEMQADAVIATPALPVIASLLQEHVDAAWLDRLRGIPYLANLCLVLELDRSLSDTYWLNVNDPGFPFVGVVEHTNFEPAPSYGGRRIVYLSRYLPASDPYYQLADDAVLADCASHLSRMFPDFSRNWIRRYHVWRADYAQPVVTPGYSRRIPATRSPLEGCYIATMAQIYPEDRGTNYAVREGRKVARCVARDLGIQAS